MASKRLAKAAAGLHAEIQKLDAKPRAAILKHLKVIEEEMASAAGNLIGVDDPIWFNTPVPPPPPPPPAGATSKKK